MDKINWKEFDYSEDGITVHVRWFSKEFVATCKTDLGELKTGLHIMYMCPKVYTEEMLRTKYCSETCSEFKKAYSLLKENPDFIRNYQNDFYNHFKEEDEEIKNLEQERRTKKKLFKAGELSKNEWLLFCKAHNQKKLHCAHEKNDYFTQYVFKLSNGKYPLTNILKDFLIANCTKSYSD